MIYSPRSLPSTAAMVKRSTHVKKRKASSSPAPAAARLPAGYAFVPPPVPLTYPATYHLIAAGPMHEAPKRKRTVFGKSALVNIVGRVRVASRKSKGKGKEAEPEVDLADESFVMCGAEADDV